MKGMIHLKSIRRLKFILCITLLIFIICFICVTETFAAPRAPAGYNPETDDIPIPPEEEYMRQQREDFAAMDAENPQSSQDAAAMERQLKELQEAAEETQAIQRKTGCPCPTSS